MSGPIQTPVSYGDSAALARFTQGDGQVNQRDIQGVMARRADTSGDGQVSTREAAAFVDRLGIQDNAVRDVLQSSLANPGEATAELTLDQQALKDAPSVFTFDPPRTGNPAEPEMARPAQTRIPDHVMQRLMDDPPRRAGAAPRAPIDTDGILDTIRQQARGASPAAAAPAPGARPADAPPQPAPQAPPARPAP